MVVLAVSILTKHGKVLMSRQSVEMTRMRIEGLLAAFPKLVGGDSQHTFVETENVRYLYQPLETLYLVLITTRQSNIMDDLDTLRTLAKLIPEYCQGHDEDAISQKVYDLIFAFDEVISLGYKENVTIQQIRTFTEMDSHEEKLQKIIMESKMNEARDEARRKADSIEKAKMEQRKFQAAEPSGYGSGSGRVYGGGSGYDNSSSSSRSSGSGSKDDFSRSTSSSSAPTSSSTVAPSKPATASKGMSLTKTKKSDAFFDALRQEEQLVLPAAGNAAASSAVAASAPEPQRRIENVKVAIEEQINCSLERDGALRKMEVKGEMKLSIADPDMARLVVVCNPPEKVGNIQFRPHPKIDAKAWTSDSQLALKDRTKPFPIGSDNATGILKWRIAVADDEFVPISVNFWPSSENGRSVVSVEYSMKDDFLGRQDPPFVLNSLCLSIPCPSRAAPDVSQCDGDFNFSAREGRLTWVVGETVPGASGSFEFSIPEIDAEQFFPIDISFNSPSTFSGLQVATVQHAETGDELPYACDAVCSCEKFVVE